MNGIGAAKDPPKAVALYQRAADAGRADAQYNLARCYSNGSGVAKDEAKAVGLYQQAANAGHADAQCSLGGCYEALG
jgi:uncharacterized protein